MMCRLPKIRDLRAVLLLLLVGIFGSFLSINLVRGGEIQNISGYLADIPPAELFEGATGYGDQLENIPIIPVLKDADIVGYTFLNTDFVSAIGYSGKPIVVIIAMAKDGIVSAARLLDHAEPIILSGIPEQKIIDFIAGYNGIDIITLAQEKGGEPPPVDIVSGATVTVMVIDDSIKRAAVRAAAALGLRGLKSRSTTPRVKKSLVPGETTTEDWQTLVGDGSVRRLHISVGNVNKAFETQGNAKAIGRPEKGVDEETYIDLYAASLAIPSIALSLLGEREYANLQKKLKPDQQAFLIMGSGRYSFRGSGYVRGGIFDRIQVVQSGEAFRFTDRGYKNLGRVATEGAPDFKEVALFRTPKGAIFDPTEPWQLQLLLQRAIGALEKVFVAADLDYQLPAKYVKTKTPPAPVTTSSQIDNLEDIAASNALWQRIWKQKIPEITILVAAIVLLTALFFVQNQIVQRRVLTDRIRIGFLIFTLFFIGFYAQAQLSVVNILVFANALLSGFQWQFFLMEPLIFILWCSVAVSLIFWGRGAFCGWLCPFGALQELTNKLAKLVGIKQITVPWWLHERLWPIKYIIFLALLGLSVYSLHLAETLAEIEPFRTSIILRFMRGWPYLMFVFSLLFAGLFIERFFCRYLCPLGAALAIPGKLAMFNWLKRYNNCGDPCHKCAQECMVQAIDPRGNINPNECLNCLHCQQLYYDQDACPVVIHALAKSRKMGASIKVSDIGEDPLYRKPRRLNETRGID
ncbi:MAG: 4Fe-4S binding protein [Sneathiella sp.]|uniref:4Fe-4S binding protein n=1 Tax=Sneathiella sp. TaxID=1964365 RepID=UPI003000FF1C